MKEAASAAIDDVASIIRAILIRIFIGEKDKSPKQCNTSLAISQIHA